MSKEAFHNWLAGFIGERVQIVGNTPAERPEGVPSDTVLITIDIRSVPRDQLFIRDSGIEARHLGPEQTVVCARTIVDGKERVDGAFEFVVSMPNDESPNLRVVPK